ncbi:MAG: polysaccharide deacetylase family protein [Bacteroidetes bacterium]|nr:polysaccharide deacetylase family protein [Bacteroidota bacterium]
MILIYSPKLSNRFKYIADFVFRDVFRWKYTLTASLDEFKSFDGPKINYSDTDHGQGIFLASCGLLLEKGIEGKEITFLEYQGMPAIFQVFKPGSIMPFDVFAACFFMLSRYEEYLPYVRDEYGRFQSKFSISYQRDFLKLPIVDIWLELLAKLISTKYPLLQLPRKDYRFIPTIDINAAFAYKYKGLIRSMAGYLNALTNLDFKSIRMRTRVLLNLEPDPYDTYVRQLEIHRKYRLDTVYFILFANYGTNDKNISVSNRKFQVLIKSLADYCDVGLHSSWSSIQDPSLLYGEFRKLSQVLNREINNSRQHFLVLNIPMTYRNLLNIDMENDYSMGYVNTPGFRAGTSRSFFFYDLDMDAATPLRIHPFAFMETAFRQGYNLDDYSFIVNQVKRTGGTMILLWNNESFSEKFRGKSGLNLYEEMIRIGQGKVN